jgi:PhnB protein
MKITPYLFFNGQCRQAFDFYAELLGGKVEAMMAYGGSPAAEHVPPDRHDLIMHGYLALGDQALMGADETHGEYKTPQGVTVSLHFDTPEECDRVFAGLAEKGTVTMPIQPTFWSLRFGMCTDRFGVPWMINCAQAPEGSGTGAS